MLSTPPLLLVHCALCHPFEVLFIGISLQFFVRYCTLKPLQCSLSFWFYPKSQLHGQWGRSARFVNLHFSSANWDCLNNVSYIVIWITYVTIWIIHRFLTLLLISRVSGDSILHSLDKPFIAEVIVLIGDKTVTLRNSLVQQVCLWGSTRLWRILKAAPIFSYPSSRAHPCPLQNFGESLHWYLNRTKKFWNWQNIGQ